MILTDHIEQRRQFMCRLYVRLKPEHLLRDDLTSSGQLKSAIDFDESLLGKPLHEAVARCSRNVETVFDLSTIEGFVQ